MPLEALGDVLVAGVLAAVESGVGGDGVEKHLGEQEVVRRVLRGAGDRRGAVHAVRETDRPLVGLLRAHRRADHGEQFGDAEVLAQEAFLGDDVIADGDEREPRHGDRLVVGGVRGRGQPVADLVDDDDEVLRRVQRVVLADVGLQPGLVGAGEPGGDEDGVVAGLVERADGGHRQLTVLDHAAVFQFQPPDADHLVGAVDVRGVEGVVVHRVLLPGGFVM